MHFHKEYSDSQASIQFGILTFNTIQVLFSGVLHYLDDRQVQIALEADVLLNHPTSHKVHNAN
jgi:hypothetical protein